MFRQLCLILCAIVARVATEKNCAIFLPMSLIRQRIFVTYSLRLYEMASIEKHWRVQKKENKDDQKYCLCRKQLSSGKAVILSMVVGHVRIEFTCLSSHFSYIDFIK